MGGLAEPKRRPVLSYTRVSSRLPFPLLPPHHVCPPSHSLSLFSRDRVTPAPRMCPDRLSLSRGALRAGRACVCGHEARTRTRAALHTQQHKKASPQKPTNAGEHSRGSLEVMAGKKGIPQNTHLVGAGWSVCVCLGVLGKSQQGKRGGHRVALFFPRLFIHSTRGTHTGKKKDAVIFSGVAQPSANRNGSAGACVEKKGGVVFRVSLLSLSGTRIPKEVGAAVVVGSLK